jgi:plastocyanin
MLKRRGLLIAVTSLWVLAVGMVPAHAGSATTFTVQLDAQAPNSEPWDFLRMFPHAISVHQGDVIDAAWGGSGAPHTASFVNTDDPEQWRADNQCDGCPWAAFLPDALLGGDDPELDFNPAVNLPSSFTCGSAGAPCSFDGSSIVNSGVQFSLPGGEPSFFVQVDAAPGTYSMLCMLHPGMEIPLTVRPPDKPVAGPHKVAHRAASEVDSAIRVDGAQADAQAQEVTAQGIGGGRIDWTINAGGFSNQVTANEYIDAGLSVHVGDEVTVLGNNEIHTATIPSDAVNTTPFLKTQCEVPGPDIPASDPSQCADPSDFQVALNNRALLPASSNALTNPDRYRNSGLLAAPGSYTFVAKVPGTYSVVSLVHGPTMTTTITVEA